MSAGKDKPGAPEPDKQAQAEAGHSLERGFEEVRTEETARQILDKALPAKANEAPPERVGPADTHLEKTAVDAARDKTPEEQAGLDAAITAAGQARPEPPKPGPAATPQALSPEAIQGRNLLRKELVKRLRPVEAVDTVLFLQINQIPHPPAVDKWMFRYSYAMTGGWAWLLVPLAAGVFGGNRKKAAGVALAIAPALWIATSLVEYPIKHYFRRRRPFTEIVRAIVVGRRAASYSFPSGHSAAAFAGAVLLHKYFPRQSPAFYTAAVLVAFSRVYLGAHYPGDVATGGFLGAVLARGVHAGWVRLLRRFSG